MSKWPQEEREEAMGQLNSSSSWSIDPGRFGSFITADVAIGLQCELNAANREIAEARELLIEAWTPYPEHSSTWKSRKIDWIFRNAERKI